ncbi:MAG TPA: HPF/RaiA family ribosome-associated protein [Thermoanaerobaculia bacterium]|nr:HPF/RaiA family ribosome-associated protein [Thermoanaerobaculia bacterium]
MELPLTINAHDIILPEPLEAVIREKAAKLDRINGHLIGCRVTIEGPGSHHRHGGPYKVRIDISLPGSELVINQKEAAEMSLAIRDAFEAARRRLEEHRDLQLEKRKEGRTA